MSSQAVGEDIARDWYLMGVSTNICLGVYAWEFLLTLYFEFEVITGKKPFRWPYIPYFLGRYFLVITFILLYYLNESENNNKANCVVAHRALTIMGNMTTGFASTNLMIRTALIWRENQRVIASLLLMTMGHWVYLLCAAIRNTHSSWDGLTLTCYDAYTSPNQLAALYLYTIVFDFFVFVLTFIGLARQRFHSYLTVYLYRQGIGYFAITCMINIIPCVLAWLNINIALDLLFYYPSVTVSTIASSRVVTMLLDIKEPEHNIQTELEMDRWFHKFKFWRTLPSPQNSQQFTTQLSVLSLP